MKEGRKKIIKDIPVMEVKEVVTEEVYTDEV